MGGRSSTEVERELDAVRQKLAALVIKSKTVARLVEEERSSVDNTRLEHRYHRGENCWALWSDGHYYEAIIDKYIDSNLYEVTFPAFGTVMQLSIDRLSPFK